MLQPLVRVGHVVRMLMTWGGDGTFVLHFQSFPRLRASFPSVVSPSSGYEVLFIFCS